MRTAIEFRHLASDVPGRAGDENGVVIGVRPRIIATKANIQSRQRNRQLARGAEGSKIGWYARAFPIVGLALEMKLRREASATSVIDRHRAFRRQARCAILGALVHASLLAAPSQAPSPAWPDTFVSRLQALALMQTLNADILASRSATESLERWCRDHQLAEPPAIAARIVRGLDRPPSAAQRQRLQIDDRDEVTYRRVQLRCGSRPLSEAENWYVPGRLSPEANRLLDTTTTPFGTVVRSLEPYRRTFDVRLLWRPLPADWAIRPPPGGSGGALAVPDALFEHRAVLYTREHVPFSEVHEVYQRQILPPSPPGAR